MIAFDVYNEKVVENETIREKMLPQSYTKTRRRIRRRKIGQMEASQIKVSR